MAGEWQPHFLLQQDELRDTVLLVFANKQHLPNAMNAAEITDKLGLHSSANAIGQLANCFQFMANIETIKKKLFEEILKIEGLEDRQIMDATEILTGDSTELHTF
uniref:Uncharacterized protein n=1 Tax=Ananas comosus var. bracteatus TaxID=296719 RepID=A0A6V7PHL0_ANACO|nr:unnamed protein product [Ananas comosus var. bracteatus]